ncbi:hypothetical protein FN846DRAFT_1007097 [Sphaerosporella brunnea]|uniref:Uncharacterized protein n=1 Tax=Sphaerosporella brunnea TaxID=1250544 RepID=A0A5J5F2J5_9PEZI|nr:hypothetical protein FN846DRAFT_1007097 [Sphaerosporella brunnea]
MSDTADADDNPAKRQLDLEDVDMPNTFDLQEKCIQPESQHQRRGTHMYCPLKPPYDVPRHPDWRDYNPSNLRPRVHREEEQTASYFVNTVDSTDGSAAENLPDESFHRDSRLSKVQLSQITHATGIQKRSSLWDLPSLIWPWSFPIDSMHLFYLNVVPNMRDHWQGNFFSWERQPGAFKTAQQATFKPSGEPYCIAPEEWKRIDQDIKSMIHPAVFGDRIRGVQEFRKANQWKTWAQVVSPIVLKNRLPEPFYSAWTQLVHGMTLATDYSVSAKDITDIQESMIQFVNHYHEVYYRYQNKRLPACRAVFHALLHVAESLIAMQGYVAE